MHRAARGWWLALPVLVTAGCGITTRTVVERDPEDGGQATMGGKSHGGDGAGGTKAVAGAPMAAGATAGAARAGAGGAPLDPIETCEYGCQPDMCGRPIAEPETLAERPYEQQIVALAVGGEHVYFGTYSNQGNGGQVGRVPLAGGDVEVLASGVQIAALALDDSHLYYVTSRNPYGSQATSLPLAGGTPTKVTLLEATPGNAIGAAVVREGWVFFHHLRANTIEHAALDGSYQQVLVELDHTLSAFEVAQSELFWVTSGPSKQSTYLHRMPAHGGEEAEAVALGELVVATMVADGDSLIVSTGYGDTCAGDIARLDKQTGKLTTLSPGFSGRSGYALAADADGVYWSNGSRHSGVWMRAKSTAATRALALEQDTPSALATSATRVYWVARSEDAKRYLIRSASK